MAREAKRACGYRKVGGLYLVAGGLASPCGGLPIPLCVCPTCGGGIKQSRGWTWIDPRKLFANRRPCAAGHMFCATCPVSNPPERAGLLWIGEAFYKTPEEFTREAAALGVSRRISAIPRGFVIGEDWIFLAHPKAIQELVEADTETTTTDGLPILTTIFKPGIFHAFQPTAIEQLVTETQSQDADFMAGLEKRGITPVVVPDDDRDHRGTVYDKSDEEPELELEAPATVH